MKINKETLQKIISEELQNVLNEGFFTRLQIPGAAKPINDYYSAIQTFYDRPTPTEKEAEKNVPDADVYQEGFFTKITRMPARYLKAFANLKKYMKNIKDPKEKALAQKHMKTIGAEWADSVRKKKVFATKDQIGVVTSDIKIILNPLPPLK